MIACMVLLPSASAGQDQIQGGNLMSSSYLMSLISPDGIPNIETASLPAITDSPTTTPGGEDGPAPASLMVPSAQGTVSAWVRGTSWEGYGSRGVSTIQYTQRVTASGIIQKFEFSASYRS
ncbi:MAG: hypothetical protein NQU46_07730 [Methanolinea sp.]|nr:hypothetical protein [Methanolinea sp.]